MTQTPPSPALLRGRKGREAPDEGPDAAGLIAACAHAGPGMAAAPNGTFLGDAYGTTANAAAGPIAASLAHVAEIGCACDGTNGQLRRRRVDSLAVGPGGSV